MSHYPFMLSVDALRIPVNLGVTEAERMEETTVTVWVKLFYTIPPDAARQDDADYLCYEVVCKKLLKLAASQEFQLLEFLTSELYSEVRELAPADVGVWVKVKKPLPPSLVNCIVEGACAILTDVPTAGGMGG